MKNLKESMDGYQGIINEIDACRKYGTDYRSIKGQQDKVISKLHPSSIEFKVIDILEETATVKTLRLAARNAYLPPFQAGQYINLFVEINGIRTSRPYSISSSPRQRAYYDITIQKVEDGFVSTYLLEEVKTGDILMSSGPSGNFHFNPLIHSKEMVCIAGGSGVTPFMSMIREALEAGLDRKIHLLYGCRNLNDIIFYEELENLNKKYENFRLSVILSEGNINSNLDIGLIDAKVIQLLTSDFLDAYYFICGPEKMYDFLETEFKTMNIANRRIKKEMFGAAADISKDPSWPKDISLDSEFNIQVQGKESIVGIAGETVLTALERAGIVVPVVCRSGECSQCRMKLISGKVFQPRGVLIRESDRKYNYIHSCKAYPLDNLEIIL